MTKSRDVFEIPHTVEKFTFTKRPADTNGELLEIEFLVTQFFPSAHIHADRDARLAPLIARAPVRRSGSRSPQSPRSPSSPGASATNLDTKNTAVNAHR